LINGVTVNETYFFREKNQFEALVNKILPELHKTLPPSKTIRILSSPCSTGEEPYTLAMVLNEFRERVPGLSFQYLILATDLSSRVLESAQRAVYHENKIDPVPENAKKKYILRSKDTSRKLVRIIPELRSLIKFRRLNFLDSNYGMREPIDIVFFRNVQIYFEKETQRSILLKIYNTMRQGGYLFIGHSETLNGLDLPFEQIEPTVYRKV
jgi:chemotaxis protein methyltransferase CheR